MESPFPGMDPYLEHPGLWTAWQQFFCTRMADSLNDVLPRRYQAKICERVYCEGDSDLFPAKASLNGHCILSRHKPSTNGRLDNLWAHAPVWHIPTTPEELRETYMEIVSTESDAQRIAVITFLSLHNKTPETKGRQLYRKHQREALAGNIHLLEIDLLRTGLHTVAAPYNRLVRRGNFHYLISLSRADRREYCEVWPIGIRDELPTISVPLQKTDSDVKIDLQSIFRYCYEAGGFSRRVDYTTDPFYPLSYSDAAWAEKVFLQSQPMG